MIELDHVVKRYDGRPVVDDLSLTVPHGAFCVLLGPSGCGKSTTLRMINRLVPFDGGTIRIAGEGRGNPIHRARLREPRGGEQRRSQRRNGDTERRVDGEQRDRASRYEAVWRHRDKAGCQHRRRGDRHQHRNYVVARSNGTQQSRCTGPLRDEIALIRSR